jgi:uncharacterized DUF497 family protein
MFYHAIIWDIDDDPNGNVMPCAEHGISKEEIETVLFGPDDFDLSRSSGYPIVFGTTHTGRHIMVVYEVVDADTVYPITAYEVSRRQES